MCEKEKQDQFPPDSPIFLVGFMGAGKTTVGRALASKLGLNFIDLDNVIQARAGRSVRAIFAESGEAEFRRLEREALRSCRGLTGAVIALGGGAFIQEDNRAEVRGAGKSVWLDCPFDICLVRIRGDQSRPLATGDDDLRSLFESRRPSYAMADLIIQTGDSSPEALVEAIRNALVFR